MNRTRKLMASVSTSVLIAGTQNVALPADDANAVPSQQRTATPAGDGKTDPEIKGAADSILKRLKGTQKSDAMTVQEISKEFPNLKQSMVQDVLNREVEGLQIKRIGEGTKESPYRYYERSGGGGG